MRKTMLSGKGRYGAEGGFTLFEVVMVLLILGVISYFAAERLFPGDPPSQRAEMELVKNHLRYAQLRAMNADPPLGYTNVYGIKFGSSTRYWLYKEPTESTVIRLPGVESNDGVMELAAIQLTLPPGNKIAFDPFGSPGTATVTLTVQTKGGGSAVGQITITRNTGFIP